MSIPQHLICLIREIRKDLFWRLSKGRLQLYQIFIAKEYMGIGSQSPILLWAPQFSKWWKSHGQCCWVWFSLNERALEIPSVNITKTSIPKAWVDTNRHFYNTQNSTREQLWYTSRRHPHVHPTPPGTFQLFQHFLIHTCLSYQLEGCHLPQTLVGV